jgi:hypothetical protein
MLAELAAINAAYSVIKEVVGNGRELYDCGESLSTFFNNKAALQKKVNAAPPDRRGQIQEFFALEKIKQQEEELRQLMQWTGRAGLWDDWLAFQAEAARARRDEAAKIERAAIARQEQIEQTLKITGAVVLLCAVIVGAIMLAAVVAPYLA